MSNLDNFTSNVYKAYFVGIALFLISLCSFVMIACCVYYGSINGDIKPTQCIFLILGVLSGVVFIYFALCYTVGEKKSKQYTDNVIRIIKAIKPDQDGLVEKILTNKISIFFMGLTALSILSVISYHASIKLFS